MKVEEHKEWGDDDRELYVSKNAVNLSTYFLMLFARNDIVVPVSVKIIGNPD
jgi:hypothetical protein